MFTRSSNEGFRQTLAGIRQKTLVYGDKSLMVVFRLEKGALLPLHSHPHEQSGYLVKGQMRLTIGGAVHEVLPGDSWCIAGDELHGAECIEAAEAVEVFAPVREDYLFVSVPPGNTIFTNSICLTAYNAVRSVSRTRSSPLTPHQHPLLQL